MIPSLPGLCLFLCFPLSLAQLFFFYYSEEEYTLTEDSTTYEVYEQDDIDAQAIVDSDFDEKVFASILPYREKVRCMTIIREIGVESGETKYIDDGYVPQEETPFRDLVFAMTKDENMVLGGYLEVFFNNKDETWIIIAMVLCKDMEKMISTHDTYYTENSFKDLRKKQRCPFEHMLRVWVRQTREAPEKGALDKNAVQQDIDALVKEYNDGAWHENRDQIEKIVIVKSIKYAQAVIAGFEKQIGKPLEDAIVASMNSDELHDIGDAYASLAKYIKNKHKYISDIMFAHCDGSNKWAAWIMSIAVDTSKEWPKIDQQFQKDHKAGSLSKFILDKMTDDEVMAEMIAAVIDPNFKPTTFTEKPLTPGAGPAPTAGPPSTPPTTTVPAPSSR